MRIRISYTIQLAILFVLWQCVLFGGNCLAQAPADQIVRVEEDWQMVLGDPEPESVAPQVTCVISPVANVNSMYTALTINNRGLPEFAPGGLQLQVWNNETPLQTKNFSNTHVLSHAGETVRWTNTMELKDGLLTFEIVNGHSATWGEFGNQGSLKAVVNSTLSNLNGYSPSVSVENSSIGFASNRVQSLVLLRVRQISSTGVITEDTTPRIVHQQQ
jgi:hypothetical protein